MVDIEENIESAAEQYKTGRVSLNRAAEIVGQSPEAFKTELRDRNVRREIGFLEDDTQNESLDGL